MDRIISQQQYKEYSLNIINLLKTSINFFKSDLQRFKEACLNSSAVLFENTDFIIGSYNFVYTVITINEYLGCTTNFENSEEQPSFLLKLYFINKSQKNIQNFKAEPIIPQDLGNYNHI